MDRETWRFINSFAPWLSALGTTAAVVVSLYLALRTARVKLQITSGIYRVASIGQRLADAPEYLQIRAINTGFREVTVQGIMWRYYGLFRRSDMVSVPPADAMSTQLPKKLEFGDEAKFLFTLPQFEEGARDTIFEIVRKARWPRLACRYLYVGVYTTTRQMMIARIDPSIRDFLLRPHW
jgi:hypothetical protein